MEYLRFALVPVLALAATALAQAILTRILRSLAVAAQAAALGGMVLGNAGILLFGWRFGVAGAGVWGWLYMLLLYNCLAASYFLISNTSETSLHVHILMELLLARGLSSEELSRRYNANHMIDARIERMVAVGQLTRTNGTYLLTGRSVLILAKVFDLWRGLLGMPRSPEEAGHKPPAR